MADIIWTVEALNRLARIREYIHQFDPAAARRISERLVRASNSLKDFPNRGRPAGGGCRELLTVRPYIIRYEVAGDEVTILRIRHAAQLSDPD